jgi:Domain of unknown function (DUF4105)
MRPRTPVTFQTRPSFARRGVQIAGAFLLGIILCSLTTWGALAIYYSDLSSPTLRTGLSLTFALGVVAGLLFVRPRRRAVFGFLLVFAGLLLWWLSIPPSHDRDWQPDVALLPSATIEGDQVTIHNIRNLDYHSETDYTVRYYDKTVQLSQLRTVDLFLSYWGSPSIAHTIMSFGFAGDQYVAISIETRKEKGEDYSAVKGFFKQYELIYVVADERDLVRLRTNYRGEDVYLYRLRGPAEVARNLFLAYLRDINQLAEHPAWYNALSANCTTAIYRLARPYAVRSWWSWKLLVNGHLDELMYENGAVDRSLPFTELKARSHINARAKAANDAADFSQKIRAGLPETKE